MSLVRLGVLAVLVLAPRLNAQPTVPRTARSAATAITEAAVRELVGLIAHDSMGGRDTPSPGLEATAKWVAAEFRRLGLSPLPDGSHVQRYPISLAAPDPDSSYLELGPATGPVLRLRIGTDLVLRGTAPGERTGYPVVMVAGRPDSATLAATRLEGALVLWVDDWRHGTPPDWRAAVAALQSAGAAGVLAVVNNDSLAPPGPAGPGLSPLVVFGPPPAATRTVAGRFVALVNEGILAASLPGAGPDVARLRAAGPAVLPLPSWQAHARQRVLPFREMRAPNVVGILPGADPSLRDEFVVISAHMDHVGIRCRGTGPGDPICNGADDNASGTAGVVALARAFASPGARPRRSLVFLTVSGEERGLWGSRYFAANPPIDLTRAVANLNMDMIGRNWRDTVVAIGKGHSELGVIIDQVAARHPELGLAVVDDLWPAENLYARSDHINFARQGVPILFFTSGLHEDYHAASDTPDRIDAEKQARILRLIFHLTAEIADRPARPQWNPASYDAIVGKR